MAEFLSFDSLTVLKTHRLQAEIGLSRIAVTALGGWGRGSLHPIDLELPAVQSKPMHLINKNLLSPLNLFINTNSNSFILLHFIVQSSKFQWVMECQG
jgi:hypothetical protein